MFLNPIEFYKACNPTATLNVAKPEQRRYYIDFSSVRGSDIIEDMCDNIAEWSPDEPTCQLFTGHIGSGKSTELLRLKSRLEEKNFHVIYFESSDVLEMGDVDVTDILIAIARQVFENLKDILPEPSTKDRFGSFLEGIKKILNEVKISIPGGIGISLKILDELLTMAKESPELRNRLRQYLEPQTGGILEAINQDLLKPAISSLRQGGKNGLVVIVDNLDRIRNVLKAGRAQPEYLFIDRGEQLQLDCHVVYTIPIELIFSNEIKLINQRFGGNPSVLPMVPVQSRDMADNKEALELMRQMVLTRAFPNNTLAEQRNRIKEIFDKAGTLERLCRVSGGHVRGLLILLCACLKKGKHLPISEEIVEDVIRAERNDMTRTISDNDWHLLGHVMKEKRFRSDEQFRQLLRNMFLFEYQDRNGSWFNVNPIMVEAK